MSADHKNYCWGKVQSHEIFLCTGGSKQILLHLQNFSHNELSNQCNDKIAEAAFFFYKGKHEAKHLYNEVLQCSRDAQVVFFKRLFGTDRTNVSDRHDFNSLSVKIKTAM